MLERDQTAPDRSRNSFAELLASFTGRQSDGWDDSALADDVSTISYEQAVRAARSSRGLEKTGNSKVADEGGKGLECGAAPRGVDGSAGKARRGASITLRVTAEEQCRLQERAAAAKLSVSAYVRSCVFEAEALRAEVKGALAQMQSAASAGSETRARRWRMPSAWWRGKTADG